jgi:hypothetical protein
MDGAAERGRGQRALAWWAGMLPRMQKPPTFEEFVNPKRKAERQSPEVLQAMCDAMAAAWGAKLH